MEIDLESAVRPTGIVMSTTSPASAPNSRDRLPCEPRSSQLRLLFLGPATIHLQTWLEEFTNAGAAVRLVTLHKPQFNRADLVDFSSRLPIPLNLLRRTRAVRKEISRWQPDVVIAYYASSYGTAARLSRFQPYVVVTAGSDINHAIGHRPHLFPFVKYALSGAAAIVCWSDTMRTGVEQLSIPRHKILVQPRGVHLNRFHRRYRTSGSQEVAEIVCLRRFSKIFNHRTLIDACRILDRRGELFRLSLCEDGPERPDIERLVIDYGLEGRVRFLGKLPPEQVADILRTCHLYVSLAQTDGASASLFEAMAAGAFPIVSDIAANRVWINDGINGLLVQPTNPEALAAAFQRALAAPSMVQAGIDRNRQFAEQVLNIRNNTQHFLELFRKLKAAAEPRGVRR